VQLYLYVKGIVSLDLGFSFRQQMPVSKLILNRLPATLAAEPERHSRLSLAFGVLFGTLAARRAGSWTDTAITVLALIFYATPAVLGRAWNGDPAVSRSRWTGCRALATRRSALDTPGSPHVLDVGRPI